jgi:excisionase family DNA binding protein
MTNSQIKALLTFEETLAILKITRPTLYKIMNNNGIDVVRIGGRVLFTENAVNDYIERCTIKTIEGGEE